MFEQGFLFCQFYLHILDVEPSKLMNSSCKSVVLKYKDLRTVMALDCDVKDGE